MTLINRTWVILAAVCLVSLVPVSRAKAASSNALDADWPAKSGGCAAKLDQSSRVTLTLHDINDVLIDGQQALTYELKQVGFPRLGNVAGDLPAGIAGAHVVPGTPSACDSNLGKLRVLAFNMSASIQRDLKAQIAHNLNGKKLRSIPLEETMTIYDRYHALVNEFKDMRNAAIDCPGYSSVIGETALQFVVFWISRAEGDHTATYHMNLDKDTDYRFWITENWNGVPTSGGSMMWRCGESDILTLSLGTLLTTLPYRSYDHQKTLVPAGSATTLDTVSVGGNSSINPLGAALLNFKLPSLPFFPEWTGLTLSSGPVYQFGGSPKVSALGYFAGLSLHLYRGVFITPGVHVGQFADFPPGFYPGAAIPADFGDLNPVKRYTAHFAIGLTYKTNSFAKKSTGTQSPTPSQ